MLKNILKILSNKYLLAIAVFLAIMLFFDQNDWFTQRARQRELKEGKEHMEYLKAEIAKMAEELDKLQTDPRVSEKYSREKYYHKKADEDVFLIKKDTVIVKSK